MIPTPSLRIIAVTLMGFLFGLCVLFFNLWRGEVSSFADYRAEVEAAGKVQEDKTKKAISDQKQITEDTTNAWKAALDHTRNYYAGLGRVRQPSSTGEMPRVSNTTSGADGACQDPIPSAGGIEEVCAETTLTLNYLQGWVESESKVSK